MKPPPRKLCEASGCKRDAKFTATKLGKIGYKSLCAAHAAEKFGKYEVELEGLR
jgi:hypothetical protein